VLHSEPDVKRRMVVELEGQSSQERESRGSRE